MKTLLVINDDPVQLHFLCGLLSKDQYQVVSYHSSEEAWLWLQQGHVPDGIVLDLHMPGISGWRFCELMQGHFPQPGPRPMILAVSATYSGSEVEDVLIDLGASAFLSLPAEPSRIRLAVAGLWKHSEKASGVRVWIVSTNVAQIERMRQVFHARGWQVVCYASGEQVMATSGECTPDFIVVDDPLSDMSGRDVRHWCKMSFPHATCILLESKPGSVESSLQVTEGDLVLSKGCDPNELLAQCEKGRWERALTRVEHLLETRTSDLRESEAQFRGLFEIIPDILVIHDQRGLVHHINAAGARQLGFSPSELLGQPLEKLFPSDQVGGVECTGVGSSLGETGWTETLLLAKDGREVHAEVTERPVRFAGKPQRLLIARDLSSRKQMEAEKAKLEQQLRQVQKMEAIGRLASGVAHDMNNIMTAILSHASLLKSRSDPQEGAWTVGDVIEKAVRRGKELTSQLLGFSRQGKHHHVSVDLHEVVGEVAHLLERTMGKTIVFQMDFQAAQPWIVGDPNQIFQVFMNLSVNACDAMGSNGLLRFSTSNETVSPTQAAHVPGLSPGDYVVIRVTDSGEGIPLDMQGKIFEPFFSTKDSGKGSGMGLAMVYGIVKNHRGYIGVTSTLGVGTMMKVYLPALSGPPPRSVPIQNTVPSKGTGHILVVDDEPEVAEAARAVLEYLGYQVSVVSNGKAAIDYCQNAGNQVDMVLLDMIMPDMAGPECFVQLKRLIPDIKVILCTGYDRNHAVQELLDQGVVAFLQKPYELDQIAKVCKELSQPVGACSDSASRAASSEVTRV